MQFRQRIERLIAQFGSQEAAPPPEETLALLSRTSKEAEADAAGVEEVLTEEGSESQKVGVTKKHWAISATVILAAGLIAAFVFWQMR